MSKVQILPKDIKNSLSQYPLSDLEMLLNDIRLAIFEKNRKAKKVRNCSFCNSSTTAFCQKVI